MLAGTGVLYWIRRSRMANAASYTGFTAKHQGVGVAQYPCKLVVCTTCSVAKRADAPPDADKTPSGPAMFRALVRRLEALLGMTSNSAIMEGEISVEKTIQLSSPEGNAIAVVPQKCLGACRQSNCVALSHPEKFQYHFTQLDADNPADVEDLVQFVCRYADDPGDMYTKKLDRPGKLATSCISRLPPPLAGLGTGPSSSDFK